MRILHTSDWHLGRQFHGVTLEDDHDHALVQILSIIDDHQPDVLIVAGDIFDRTNPPQSALKRLSEFLRTVRATSSAAIVLIAGNHDSAAQIGALGVLATDGEAIVRGPLDEDERPLVLSDAHGPVAISALPFAFEYAARLCFEDQEIACPADVIRAQLASARKHVSDGMRWVVVAHAFVDGAATSESERPLMRMVGGIESDYISAQASGLAERLEDGVPCPVCGGSDHPQPAHGTGDAGLLEKAWRGAQTASIAAAKIDREAQSRASSAKATLEARQATVSDLVVPQRGISEVDTEYQHALAAINKLGGIADVTVLAKEVGELRDRKLTTATKLQQASSTLGDATTAEAFDLLP